MLEFKLQGVNEDGEKLYRLMIDGAVVAEELTIDAVIAEIHRRDEEILGEDHTPGKTDCHTSAAALVRNDGSPAGVRRRACRRPGATR